MMAPSQDKSAGAAATARATRQLVKQVAATLSGKRRGPDRGVRRDSYDVDDPRARVFKPIGGGWTGGALAWLEDLVKCAKEFDAWTRDRGGGFFTPSGHRFYPAETRTGDMPADVVPVSTHGALMPHG